MTTTVIDAATEQLAWTGLLRREHQRRNSWDFGGQLEPPAIEWVELEDGINATYGRSKGAPVFRFNLATIAGIPFLGSEYRTTVRRARLAETLWHEMAHQAADELHGYPPTGDQDVDHRAYGFRLACSTLGIVPAKCSAEWLYY